MLVLGFAGTGPMHRFLVLSWTVTTTTTTCNTRFVEKMKEKSDQHMELVKLLTEEGWKVQYTDKHRVILGTAGAIFNNTASLFQDVFKINKANTDSTLNKLSALAVNKGYDIITHRRRLDSARLPATMHPCNRRYNRYNDS